MKKNLFPLLLLCFFCGCTAYVEVDGRRYAALSRQEKANLIAVSRQALANNVSKGLVTAAEYRFARNNPPTFQVHYRGDRYGSAVICWRTPERLLEFHFENDLTAERPVCAFSTAVIPEHERRLQPDKSIPGR